MIYTEIEEKLKSSPSIKLLRSKNASLIYALFKEQFKEKNEISVANDLLVSELASLLDNLNYTNADEEIIDILTLDSQTKAKRYIEKWTEDNFLSNYIDESTGKIYNMLTRHSEKAIQMFELLEEREFVGTESKFKDIFGKLEDVVHNSLAEKEERISILETKKLEIEARIEEIKSDAPVKVYEDYQIRSRMDEVYRLTNELVGDFKEVEDNFKKITKTIYEKQTEEIVTKGSILGFAFDSIDKLKESDQGKSFYSFWRFLMNESEQENLKNLIDKSLELLQERNLSYNDKFLRRFKTGLLSAAQQVLESNNQLAEKLTRLIGEKRLNENRKSRETIRIIRNLALKYVNKESEQENINILSPYCEVDSIIGFSIELEPDINLPLERKLCEQQTLNEYNIIPKMSSRHADLGSLSKLFNTNLIDKTILTNNVRNSFGSKKAVTLKEIINMYPLSKGLGELVAYINLKSFSNKIYVNAKVTEPLLFDSINGKYLEAPQIIFNK
ncbi:MAG: DUF3375 domain-containing protein [Bacteroidales bacterium]|nr:DUF3375 domain-containing protein [Bacteroidales bacterium]